jgi:hypothetical protein
MISINDVKDIDESPFQLPPKFANQIYLGGETGMGRCEFSLDMNNGSTMDARFYYSLGNLVDFIEFPKGFGPSHVTSVQKGGIRGVHTLNPDLVLHGPPYAWCLYREPEDIARRVRNESPSM